MKICLCCGLESEETFCAECKLAALDTPKPIDGMVVGITRGVDGGIIASSSELIDGRGSVFIYWKPDVPVENAARWIWENVPIEKWRRH